MRRLLLLVGTDHHAFQRAVAWADARAAAHPEERVFIQHGRSAAPAVADGADFLTPAQLRAAVAEADVVITHGGPGTISDARQGHHVPLVLPRDPQRGEHVDDHQMRFAAWSARRGLVMLVRTTMELDALVDGLGEEGTREPRVDDPETAAAIAAVGALVDSPTRRPAAVGAPLLLHLEGADAGRVTAVEDALATLPGVLVLGAVESVWTAGVADDAMCACGRRFSQCPLWVEIGRRAFGGWEWASDSGAGPPREVGLFARLARARRHPGRARRVELLAASAPYRAIVRAARDLSGATVVTDSGSSGLAVVLSHDRRIDLRVLRVPPAAARRSGLAHRRVPSAAVDPREEPYVGSALRAALGELDIELPEGSVGEGAASGPVHHPPVARLD